VKVSYLVKRPAGCSQQEAPGQGHRNRFEYLGLVKVWKGRAKLVQDQMWLSQLFDREHLKAHISQDYDLSILVSA
jgi:hypothetical protein